MRTKSFNGPPKLSQGQNIELLRHFRPLGPLRAEMDNKKALKRRNGRR